MEVVELFFFSFSVAVVVAEIIQSVPTAAAEMGPLRI